MSSEKFCLMYSVCASEEEATGIGRLLVEKKLAACVNILPGMKSIYSWKGEICQDNEVVLIVKTRRSKSAQVTEEVVKGHSYECPAILELPIEGGHKPYLDWLLGETI